MSRERQDVSKASDRAYMAMIKASVRARDWQQVVDVLLAFGVDVPSLVRGSPFKKTANRPLNGFVYYARIGSSGPVKIGWAVNPVARMRSLQVGTPDPIKLLAVEPGTQVTEYERHAKFRDSRVTGEWFDLSPALIVHIESLRSWGVT